MENTRPAPVGAKGLSSAVGTADEHPATSRPESPVDAMLQMIGGFWVSRAIYAAARLGLADHLERGPCTAEELASATCTHAPSLYRLLRALAGAGIFRMDEEGRFSLAPPGATLLTDTPGSLRFCVLAELGQENYQAWEHLVHSLRTGGAAFEHRFGLPVEEFYAVHEESATTFVRSTCGIRELTGRAVLQAYDFSWCRTVVEVETGVGDLLARVLTENPTVTGVLYESPQSAGSAWRRLESQGLTARCEVVAGDPLQRVPSGGSAYLLNSVLHRRDDPSVLTILRNCRRAMRGDGRLLIVEAVAPPSAEPSLVHWLDLRVLVVTGGRQRTEPEYRQLLAAAGFRVARVLPTDAIVSVIEAVPDPSAS